MSTDNQAQLELLKQIAYALARISESSRTALYQAIGDVDQETRANNTRGLIVEYENVDGAFLAVFVEGALLDVNVGNGLTTERPAEWSFLLSRDEVRDLAYRFNNWLAETDGIGPRR